MARAIVAGLDGSTESFAAADWAAREALRRSVALRLVHAWEPGPYSYIPMGGPEPDPEWAGRVPQEAAEVIKERYPQLAIDASEQVDHPVAVLTEAARDAELLVLGSRGLSGLTGFLVGSVALAVVARVERPVVLVRAEPEPKERGVPGESAASGAQAAAQPRVVLGLKLGRMSDALLEFAFDAAQRRSAQLQVVHTWNFPPVYGYAAGGVDPTLLQDVAREESRALTEALVPWRDRFPGVEVVELVESGRPGAQLTEHASGADLVVVGRRIRRSPIGTHVGPVVHSVMHHCAAPIAVVAHD